MGDESAMRAWAEELVSRARTEGVELTGDDGLLTALVRRVLQTGLEVEMSEHLGYEPHAVEGRGSGNSRNGSYPTTVTTEIGKVEWVPGTTLGPGRQIDSQDNRNGVSRFASQAGTQGS